MLFPEHFIEDLKNRADIIRLIDSYVPLKKKGANWMACCPFHQEKTPSFSVNPAKGVFKCFGCGKGGNVFSFVMEMEGVGFPEAIRIVADKSAIALPQMVTDGKFALSKQHTDAAKKLAADTVELNALALEFFEETLQQNNKESKAARAYLEKRGISIETQKTFRIGYAADSWDALLSHLKSKGTDEKLIEQSGLVSISEEKNRVYDRFRGRLIFPVLDIKGKPVAFGGRIIGKGEPKYLNSPETPAYIKGDHLYGLFQNRDDIRKKTFAILVEGYLDLIALYQFDVRNVVASLGTAFTPNQAKLLGRYSRKVVVNYDGDSAGINAAKRAIETLVSQDIEIKVLVLPEGKDPDDFIRENGTEKYSEARGNARPYLPFLLESATKNRDKLNAKHKQAAVEEILPIVTAIRKPLEKRESFDQVMSFFQIDDSALRKLLWSNVKNTAEVRGSEIKRSFAQHSFVRITVAETKLLELLLSDAELRRAIIPQFEQTDYEALATSVIFYALVSGFESGAEINREFIEKTIAGELDENFIEELYANSRIREAEEPIDESLIVAESCLLALRKMAIEKRVSELGQHLRTAEEAGELDRVKELFSEQLELERLRHDLNRAANRTAA